MAKKGVISAKLPDHSRLQFHLSLLGALTLMGTWRHLAAKVGMYKGRGKQWQTTPKNLPRMQRARAIQVAWLGSGSCQNRPKGWILMMMINLLLVSTPRWDPHGIFQITGLQAKHITIGMYRPYWNDYNIIILKYIKLISINLQYLGINSLTPNNL
jgi:hypothetical protein